MRRVGWKTQALIPSVPQGGLQPYPDTAGPQGWGWTCCLQLSVPVLLNQIPAVCMRELWL